jgi:hypothetical protein
MSTDELSEPGIGQHRPVDHGVVAAADRAADVEFHQPEAGGLPVQVGAHHLGRRRGTRHQHRADLLPGQPDGAGERAEVAAEQAAGQGGQRAVQILEVGPELTEFGLLKEHRTGQAAATEGGRDQVELAARGGRQVAGRDAPLGRILQVEPGQLIE